MRQEMGEGGRMGSFGMCAWLGVLVLGAFV